MAQNAPAGSTESFLAAARPASVPAPAGGRHAVTDALPGRTAEGLRHRSATSYLSGGGSAGRLDFTASLAARALGFPAALVIVTDQDTDYRLASAGVHPLWPVCLRSSVSELMLRTGLPVVVEDANSDPRCAHWTVSGNQFRSCLAVPLVGRESLVVGMLCVFDQAPRTIPADQLSDLMAFARMVDDQLENNRRAAELPDVGAAGAARLARALGNGDIVPWYQPVVDLRTRRTVGFEALARWSCGDEVLLPDGFVPLAEDSELIVELDLAVLRQASADLRRWQRSDPALRMSVNLSGRHLRGGTERLEAIRQAVVDVGVCPATVDLELTESAAVPDDMAQVQVHRLREWGFRVWLDDFGTGWSTPDALRRLPVDGVKIDRSMTAGLGSARGDAVVRSLVGLAVELGVAVIVEGIETEATAAAVRSLGCGFGQGYLWSRAVPAAEVDARRQTIPVQLPW